MLARNSKIGRRQLLRLTGLAVVSTALAACASPASTPSPAASGSTPAAAPTSAAATAAPTAAPSTAPASEGSGKELRFISSAITTLDTYQYSGGMYSLHMLGLKEGLVEFDENWNVRPLQAESWEASADGLEYTFKLREDNKWYDGTPVTAHDYVAAIHYQMEPDRNSKYSWDSPFGYLENAIEYRSGAAPASAVGAIAVDDYTLRFKLARPYPAFVTVLAMTSCYSIHRGALEKFQDKWAEVANFQGNGPYMVEEFVLDSHITVVPNPNYNLSRGNLSRITMRFQGKPLEAYQAGEIDLATLGTVSDVVVASNDPTLKNEMVMQETTGLEYLGFLNNENGFFYDNPLVRRAIAHAFDTASIIQGIWMGMKSHVSMLSEPIQPDYDPNHPHGKYDVALAKQLLAEAGFPDGQGLPKIRLFFPSYQTQDYVSTWTAIAQALKENIGLEVELRNEEIGIYGQHYQAPMNEDPWFGLVFMASGKPWKDPMHAWDKAVIQFDNNEKQKEFAKLLKEQADIASGAMTIPRNGSADFDAVVEQITELRDQAMAVYANGAHGEHLRTISENTFKGWIEQATKHATDGKAGTDVDKNWQDTNNILWRAKIETFVATNRRKEAWDFLEWQQAALWANDEQERLSYAKRAYDLHANDSWLIPLWVANGVHLVKPYVKGVRWIPFWWDNLYQVKTISIE